MKNIALIAYTAGMIDGEGSIQINPGSSSTKTRYWYLTVQVSNGDLETLNWLRDQWDLGTVTFWKPRGSRKYRVSGNWRINGSEQLQKFLKTVLPYLHIKKWHAELAFEFLKYVGFKKGQITPEISEQRRRIALEMRKLNSRTSRNILTNKIFKMKIV